MRASRIAVLVGALSLAMVAAIAGVTWFLLREQPRPDDQADCSGRMGTTCTDVPLTQIEEVARVDLPEGTRVLSSEYQQFQDWHLAAVVELPEGAADPTTSAEARRLYDGLPHDGVTYGVTRETVEGRTRLSFEVFTT